MKSVSRALILGLGNDILSDDAVGLFVARRLAVEFAHDSSVDVRETSEMGLALLDFISGYDSVFIVDSIRTDGAKPGMIREFELSQFSACHGRTPHFLGITETMELGRRLGMPMPASVRIFAVEAADTRTFSERLTPGLERELPAITRTISEIVSRG